MNRGQQAQPTRAVGYFHEVGLNIALRLFDPAFGEVQRRHEIKRRRVCAQRLPYRLQCIRRFPVFFLAGEQQGA